MPRPMFPRSMASPNASRASSAFSSGVRRLKSSSLIVSCLRAGGGRRRRISSMRASTCSSGERPKCMNRGPCKAIARMLASPPYPLSKKSNPAQSRMAPRFTAPLTTAFTHPRPLASSIAVASASGVESRKSTLPFNLERRLDAVLRQHVDVTLVAQPLALLRLDLADLLDAGPRGPKRRHRRRRRGPPASDRPAWGAVLRSACREPLSGAIPEHSRPAGRESARGPADAARRRSWVGTVNARRRCDRRPRTRAREGRSPPRRRCRRHARERG